MLIKYPDVFVSCFTGIVDWGFIFLFIIYSFGWYWEVTQLIAQQKVKMLFHLRPAVISTNTGMFTSFHVCFPYYCTMLSFFFHLERSFPNKIPEDFWNIQYVHIHTHTKTSFISIHFLFEFSPSFNSVQIFFYFLS